MTKPLLETSRNGYLAAISASSYSYVSLLKHFLPILNTGMSPILHGLHCITSYFHLYHFIFYFYDFVLGGSSISLTYIASERIIPGYVVDHVIESTYRSWIHNFRPAIFTIYIPVQIWWWYEFCKSCAGE